MPQKLYLVIGASKSIGLEFIHRIIKNKNNFIIGVSRGDDEIKKKNYKHLKADFTKKKSIDFIIKEIQKTRLPIDNIIFSVRNRSSNNNIEKEFQMLIFNPIFLIKKIISNNLFSNKKSKSVIFIGSALKNTLTSFGNLDYLLPRLSLKHVIESLAFEYKKNELRFFSVEPFIFIKKENAHYMNKSNPIYKQINQKSNFKIVTSEMIVDFLIFLQSSRSNLLNGQSLRIDGNSIKGFGKFDK